MRRLGEEISERSTGRAGQRLMVQRLLLLDLLCLGWHLNVDEIYHQAGEKGALS